jgi:hypothetical protein
MFKGIMFTIEGEPTAFQIIPVTLAAAEVYPVYEFAEQPELYAALTRNTDPDRFDLECGMMVTNEGTNRSLRKQN